MLGSPAAAAAARTCVASKSARRRARARGPGLQPGRSWGLRTLIQRFRKQSVPAQLVNSGTQKVVQRRVFTRERCWFWVFSLHLELNRAPGWPGSVPGSARARPSRDLVPVTCGARPAVPHASVHAKDKKSWLFFQSPGRTDTIKSSEYPHFHTARAAGPSPGGVRRDNQRRRRVASEISFCKPHGSYHISTAGGRLIREPSESGLGPSGG